MTENYQRGDLLTSPGSLNFIDIDKVYDSPEEAAKLMQVLHNERIQRNTMMYSDFKKYIPIFQYEGRTRLGPYAYDNLCNDYYTRICPFDPVTIVDDDGETVLMQFPPMFSRTNPVNLSGPNGVDIATAFNNANASPDEFDKKKQYYAGLFAQALKAAQNPEQQKKIRELSEQLTNDVLNKTRRSSISETHDNPEIEDMEIPISKDNVLKEKNVEYL